MNRTRAFPAMGVLLVSGACAEPFSVERHALGPPRLAALGVHDGIARAAVWSGLGPWHAQSPELEWFLDGEPLGTGYSVPVPDMGTLGVVVGLPDATELEGEVTVGSWPGLGLTRQVVGRPEDLSIDGRLGVTHPVPVSGAATTNEMVRLTALRGDLQEGEMRWMLAKPDWSILELEPGSADVVAAQVQFDDGVVDEVIEAGGGLSSVLALSIDGAGNNAWAWVDVAFGGEDILLPVQGRLFAISPETATDAVLEATSSGLPHVIATLSVTDSGLMLVDVEAGTHLSSDVAAHPAPDCAPGGAFDLWAVAEGRCPLSELDGVRVVLERD